MSRAPEVRTALAAVLAAALPDTVGVVAGREVTGDPDHACFVGYDGNKETETDGITTQRQPAVEGQPVFDEVVTITCGLVVNGEEPEALCDLSYGFLTTAESAIDNDPSLGLSGVSAFVATSQYQDLWDNGLKGWLVFFVQAACL